MFPIIIAAMQNLRLLKDSLVLACVINAQDRYAAIQFFRYLTTLQVSYVGVPNYPKAVALKAVSFLRDSTEGRLWVQSIFDS
jgi:hypothetical protein